MLKLKNVSKFYYNKGIVASGFSRVNIEFNIGEFVAITGESGSGKSTLLNVISGLDSYEEGEMYINGLETSHYNELDFEEYRKKYIANIFQNFNLINSYTVYQNIELILLINGFKKKDIKDEVLDLIKKVGLEKYRRVKVSKLSGGQKQRVAIARALAKDTPIIIADEPTGNLDKRSAEGIIKLLSEIKKDKLVIIVTHNYEQISKYVTRKIKMHDGKIIEDITLNKVSVSNNIEVPTYNNITFLNKLRLGIRNTFNILPKFLLLFVVYLFLVLSVIMEYTSYNHAKYENSLSGYNTFFPNASDKRIIIKKNDKTAFSNVDYDNIKKLDNIETVFRDDLLLDIAISIYKDDYYFTGYVKEMNSLNKKIDLGRTPTSDNEVILFINKDDYYLQNINDFLEKDATIEIQGGLVQTLNYNVKIVGIIYNEEENYTNYFYVSDKILNDIRIKNNMSVSNAEIKLPNNILTSSIYNSTNMLYPSTKVNKGTAIISEELNYLCKNNKCNNTSIEVSVSNIYYKDNINLTITGNYNKKNFNTLFGNISYDTYNGAIFINEEDYYSLYNKGYYQSSVFIKDELKYQKTIEELNKLELNTLYTKDIIANPQESYNLISNIISLILMGILFTFIFFISYFIIKLILKSRNVYFSTLRILGSTKKVIKNIIDIELFNISNLSYFLVIIFILLNKIGVLKIEMFNNLIKYLKISDYIILYIIISLLSKLISRRFSKGMFKSSAMNTIRKEV